MVSVTQLVCAVYIPVYGLLYTAACVCVCVVQVNVTVDYLKPAQDSFPERTCCTVNREAMYVRVVECCVCTPSSCIAVFSFLAPFSEEL